MRTRHLNCTDQGIVNACSMKSTATYTPNVSTTPAQQTPDASVMPVGQQDPVADTTALLGPPHTPHAFNVLPAAQQAPPASRAPTQHSEALSRIAAALQHTPVALVGPAQAGDASHTMPVYPASHTHAAPLQTPWPEHEVAEQKEHGGHASDVAGAARTVRLERGQRQGAKEGRECR